MDGYGILATYMNLCYIATGLSGIIRSLGKLRFIEIKQRYKEMKKKMKMLLASVVFLISSISGTASAASDPVVYSDGFGFDWSVFVWGGTVNSDTAADTPFMETRYISGNFTQTWSGLTFSPRGGFNTAWYTDLSLAVRNWDGVEELDLYAVDINGKKTENFNLSNYVDTSVLSLGDWKWVRIPIASLKLSNPIIKSVSIETSRPSIVHFDAISFNRNAIFYEGVNKQRGTSVQLFSWNAVIKEPYVEPGHLHNNVLRVDFSQPGQKGGVEFKVLDPAVFWSFQYNYFVVWVKTFSWDQTLYAYFINADTKTEVLPPVSFADYLPGKKHTPGVWQRVAIPMSAFIVGNGGNQVRVGSIVIVNKSVGPVLIDHMIVTK